MADFIIFAPHPTSGNAKIDSINSIFHFNISRVYFLFLDCLLLRAYKLYSWEIDVSALWGIFPERLSRESRKKSLFSLLSVNDRNPFKRKLKQSIFLSFLITAILLSYSSVPFYCEMIKVSLKFIVWINVSSDIYISFYSRSFVHPYDRMLPKALIFFPSVVDASYGNFSFYPLWSWVLYLPFFLLNVCF